jgi:hypothetical protein
VVGYPAARNTDSLARQLAQDAKEMLGGEIVVVDNWGARDAVRGRCAAQRLYARSGDELTNAPWIMDIPKNLIERFTALVWLGRPQKFHNSRYPLLTARTTRPKKSTLIE